MRIVKENSMRENRLNTEALSSISEMIKPSLKKALPYSFNLVRSNPLSKKMQNSNPIKMRVTQFVEISILSIACKFFGFLRLTQN